MKILDINYQEKGSDADFVTVNNLCSEWLSAVYFYSLKDQGLLYSWFTGPTLKHGYEVWILIVINETWNKRLKCLFRWLNSLHDRIRSSVICGELKVELQLFLIKSLLRGGSGIWLGLGVSQSAIDLILARK